MTPRPDERHQKRAAEHIIPMKLETMWAGFETRFVENPAYLSVIVRWITCAVAALVVCSGAAPASNLRHAWVALALVVAWCVALTLGPFVQRRQPQPLTAAMGAGADIFFSAWILYITGGFRSPFYEFALTSVIAPSLLFRMRGALYAAVSFGILFFVAVDLSAPGFDAVIREGKTDGTLLSSITNPFTVGIFCALLGHVVRRLHQARERAKELAMAEERNRIAREIHDGIAQRLFMLTLNLETCAELSRRVLNATAPALDMHDLEQRLESLMTMSKHALLEVRHYINDVKPLIDEQTTLGESLRSQIREFENVSGMKVVYEAEGEEKPLSVGVKTALFRIVQEAMANAFKHARATELHVSVKFGDGVSARVRDDGAGFDVSHTRRRDGIGLDGMRQRAEEAGGRLQITSAETSGTCVEVVLPDGRPSHSSARARKAKD